MKKHTCLYRPVQAEQRGYCDVLASEEIVQAACLAALGGFVRHGRRRRIFARETDGAKVVSYGTLGTKTKEC